METTNMQKDIKVTSKSVYGSVKYYPHCDTSKLFADIAGTKTITADLIALLKSRGFTITVHAPTVAL